MAEDKSGFVLYADQKNLFEQLDDDEAGRLIKHIFRYVNDENPTCPDKITKISFEPIKSQLKRDLIKYEKSKLKRSEAGKKGMEKRWKKEEEIITNHNNVINDITKITVTVKDKVIVNDTVTVKDILFKEESLIEIFFKDLENSSDLETIAMNNHVTKDFVKSKITEFRKFAELSYPTYQLFARHFKNWIRKNLTPIVEPESKIQTVLNINQQLHEELKQKYT